MMEKKAIQKRSHHYNVVSVYTITTYESVTDAGSIGKIPSPGERVAPKGSGEECGRSCWMGWNLKACSGVVFYDQPMSRSVR